MNPIFQKARRRSERLHKIRTPLGYSNSMPPLLPASFEFASDNTTSANAGLRPRLSTGLCSCFFLIFYVFARRYNSSAITSRWGCGDGYNGTHHSGPHQPSCQHDLIGQFAETRESPQSRDLLQIRLLESTFLQIYDMMQTR